MATALVGLGSNLGDRAAALAKSIELLKDEPRIRVEAVSSFRQSKPAGGPEGQGEFINAAARLETSLSPEKLLARLLAIEDQIGRAREERWGPRVIDLDLLLYDQLEMKTPTLELPHPRMCYRRFVLEPAAEIAGEMVWPVNGWSVATLLQNLNFSNKYLAISLSEILELDELLSHIQSATHCRLLLGHSLETLSFNQRLESIAHLILASSWPRDPNWTVSDFWFDRSYIHPEWWEAKLPESTRDGLRTWKLIRQSIAQPRLVVILQDPPTWWALSCRNTRATDEAFMLTDSLEESAIHEIFHKRLRAYCHRADCPPTLWLPSDDLERVEQEVLAAMQAME